MSENKTSVAQLKATRAYEKRNPDKTKHDTARRQARRYIRDFLKEDGIEEIKNWILLAENGRQDEIQ